jgi:hypothetical protein
MVSTLYPASTVPRLRFWAAREQWTSSFRLDAALSGMASAHIARAQEPWRLKRVCGSRTCKPNSVRRIAPAGRSFLWAAHYCAAQATYPEVVAHRAGTRPRRTRGSLPIWSCSVWGLPCPPHYCDSGALLPHLFTLTLALPPGRCIFCGTFRRMNPPKQSLDGAPSRTLSGTLLCGVRTFLPRHLTRRERPSGPAANGFIVTVVGLQPRQLALHSLC